MGTSDDEFSQFPVESIARFLSVCGNEDPRLARRSRVPPAVAGLERIHSHLPPPLYSASSPQRHADDATDQSAYLEELVSIAVSSARQAEDVARDVRAASASARRRMFAISAFGAIGILTGIVGISGARFGIDIFGVLPIRGNEFAAADKQSAEPRAVVAVQSPPATATTTQPSRPQPPDELPHDLAMLPRTAEPPLTPAPVQAAQHDNPGEVVVQNDPLPLRSQPTSSALAKLTGTLTVETLLHQNAARDAAELQAAAPARDDGAMDRTPAPILAPTSVEPVRGTPRALAFARDTTITPSKPWQLVAAVRALEVLTNAAGEPGASVDDR